MIVIFYPILSYYKIRFLFWFGRQDIPLPNIACVLDYYALRHGIFLVLEGRYFLPKDANVVPPNSGCFLSASLILKIPGNTSVINFSLYE